MKFRGIADSFAGASQSRPACQNCGGTSTIGHGLCLGCLLQSGLSPEDNEECLETVLAEIKLSDTDWYLANYQVLEEIGRGGMGVIYRARQAHSHRIVALKRMLGFHSDSSETLSRFEREAQAAASLDHPNILPIYEVGRCQNGLPFFSMKFASGGSLLQAMPALRNETRDAVELVAKIARAVDYAHGKGILHRDLKPGNVLLDSRGEPFVSDFGLAKWLDTSADLTRTLTIFGTPGYIAPEQAQTCHASLGPAVDIYSLGAILFELLSGRPPFLGEHAIAVIQQARDQTAPKLRTVAAEHDRDLETICQRCLEREPSARYPSAADLADDLTRWLERRPIRARPVPFPVRAWRWSCRNPAMASCAALISVLLGLLLENEIQERRLERSMQENAVANHTLIVAPLFDLDEIRSDTRFTSVLAEALRFEMSRLGPSRVTALTETPSDWSGSDAPDEVRDLAKRNSGRAVLTGTVRRVGDKLRFGLHFARADGEEGMFSQIITVSQNDTDHCLSRDLVRAVYGFVGGSPESAKSAQSDATDDERVRAFVVAGRDLMSRRTVAEVDRAIVCFENAIRENPNSVAARSFLAMALMGRDFLLSDPTLAPRALRVAREAVRLAPADPTANRAMGIVCATNGLPAEALEYGFRSLEFGDRSGRAFGQIAYSWRAQGHPDKAIRWYQKAKAAQHHPGDFEALIGDCWSDLGDDQQARAAYESAATFQPDQPEGWLGLARLKLLNGDTTGAREICRAQLLHYPDSPIAKQFGALVEFYSRNYLEAERRYRELADLDPLGGGRDGYSPIDYRSAIARLQFESNDEKALGLARQIMNESKLELASSPESTEVLYRLAGAEAMLGQTEDCLRHLQAAIDAGWIDYRSPEIDPRFDNVSSDLQFRNLLSGLAIKMARLRRQSPAVTPSAN